MADDVDLFWAFKDTQCESTSCGVVQFADQSDCSVPRTGNVIYGHVVVASASGGRRGPVSLSFTVPAYKGPPAPTPAPTATTTTVTTRPHYYEDDRAEI